MGISDDRSSQADSSNLDRPNNAPATEARPDITRRDFTTRVLGALVAAAGAPACALRDEGKDVSAGEVEPLGKLSLALTPNTERLRPVTNSTNFSDRGVHGVDLGASVTHGNQTLVFFGDAWVAPSGVPARGDWAELWWVGSPGEGAFALAASSRHEKNEDVFWVRSGGAVAIRSCKKAEAVSEWDNEPWNLAPTGAQPGALATCSRGVEHLDVCWIGPDGAVVMRSWNGGWGNAWQVAPAGAAAIGGALAMCSRHPGHVDVCWIGPDGEVRMRSWEGDWGNAWELAPAKSAATGGALAMCSRRLENVDVCWIGPNGEVRMRSWNADSTPQWSPAWQLAPAWSASTTGALAMRSLHPGILDVFWIGGAGEVKMRYWEGVWNPPIASDPWVHAPAGSAAPNGALATYSRHAEHLDVCWIDPGGAVVMHSWNGWSAGWGQAWQLAPLGSAAASGGALAMCSRNKQNHLDVFWTGPRGGVVARSWNGGGPIPDSDPVAWISITSPAGITLEPVTNGQVFAPFTIRKPNGFVTTLQTNQVPTGAFSHDDGHCYVFALIHEYPRAPLYPGTVSYLTRSASPSSGQPFEEVFRWSEGRFWQVSPVVVNNADVPGLPSTSGKGVILFAGGKRGQFPNDTDHVHLAWMPLTSGQRPRLENIRYFTGANQPWSANESDATAVFNLLKGYTSISAAFVTHNNANLWVLLYSEAQFDLNDPQYHRPDRPLIAAIARNPAGPWTRIELFTRGDTTFIDRPSSTSLGGFPYGAYLIADHALAHDPLFPPLTKWDPATRVLDIHYLLSSWSPCQVHHLHSWFTVTL